MFAETLDTDIDQTLEDELKYSISAINNNTVRSYRNHIYIPRFNQQRARHSSFA